MGLRLEKISKFYGDKSILKDVSMNVKENSFHVILGPSGCGKSTLLSILAGIIPSDSGSISYKGKRIDRLSSRERNIGIVFQDYSLFPHLNVFDNIAYGLRTRKTDNNEIKKRVKKYLSITGMTMYRDLFPHELSGGQKQRVALARSLVVQPSIMLFDEPLSHLDPSLNEQLKRDLLNIQKEEKFTALYVTHNMDEAYDLATEISILNRGTIEQSGTPMEVHHGPSTNFVASFMGVENIFSCTVVSIGQNDTVLCLENHEEQKKLYINSIYYPIFAEKKSVHITIDPEYIDLTDRGVAENSLSGIVETVTRKGLTWKIIVNISGHRFIINSHTMSPPVTGEKVSLLIQPEAVHPVCGRVSKRPEHQRQCTCGQHICDKSHQHSAKDYERKAAYI